MRQMILNNVRFRPSAEFPHIWLSEDGFAWKCLENKLFQINVYLHRNKPYIWFTSQDGSHNYGRCLDKLILETFIGPRPKGHVPIHFPDPSLRNCSLQNLRYAANFHHASHRPCPRCSQPFPYAFYSRFCRNCINAANRKRSANRAKIAHLAKILSTD